MHSRFTSNPSFLLSLPPPCFSFLVPQAKIKKFQQLTDRFRGGLIKAPVYYKGVEDLFGEANVEVRADSHHNTLYNAKCIEVLPFV